MLDKARIKYSFKEIKTKESMVLNDGVTQLSGSITQLSTKVLMMRPVKLFKFFPKEL